MELSVWIENIYHGFTILLVLFFIGFMTLILYWLLSDLIQRKNAIRRNYPVIGRFRGLFEHLGTFFRQYFFAMDREEMP